MKILNIMPIVRYAYLNPKVRRIVNLSYNVFKALLTTNPDTIFLMFEEERCCADLTQKNLNMSVYIYTNI